MVISMSTETDRAKAAKSDCFYATYTTVSQVKFLLEEIIDFPKTWNWFNLFVYIPTHQWNNSLAMYEYCNLYLYVVQLQLMANMDFAILTEVFTRVALVLSSQAVGFFEDMDEIFKENSVDFFTLGYRQGMIVRQMFDIKFD